MSVFVIKVTDIDNLNEERFIGWPTSLETYTSVATGFKGFSQGGT